MKNAIIMNVNDNAKVLKSNLTYEDLVSLLGKDFTVSAITGPVHLHDFEEVPEGTYQYCMFFNYKDKRDNFKISTNGTIHTIRGNVLFAKIKFGSYKDFDFEPSDIESMCPRELNAFFNWLGLHFLFSEKGNEVLDLYSLLDYIKTMADNDKEVYDKEVVIV